MLHSSSKEAGGAGAAAWGIHLASGAIHGVDERRLAKQQLRGVESPRATPSPAPPLRKLQKRFQAAEAGDSGATAEAGAAAWPQPADDNSDVIVISDATGFWGPVPLRPRTATCLRAPERVARGNLASAAELALQSQGWGLPATS